MNKNDCIFCKIVNGETNTKIIYQDDQVTAFEDIKPIAPVHILIVPNHHISSVNQIDTADEPILGHMINIAKKLAAQENVHESGYRLVINTGPQAGQTVFHIHLHLIGGRRLSFSF